MGKLIRNGIEYGGGNGTDIFKVTQAEYDALVQAGTLVHNALYVISDAPNLNPTADDIEYSSGVTVADKLTSLTSSKANKEIVTLSFTSTNDGVYTIPTATIPLSKYPVFAWEETEMQNYFFPITNYRNSSWMIWCRIAGTLAVEPNKVFTVKVLVLS